MEEKKSKSLSAEPGVSEYWAAGGPVWINFANSQVLASKGMEDVVASAESLSWWFAQMELTSPHVITAEDLTFARDLRESFSDVLASLEQGSEIRADDLELFNSVLAKQHEWYQLALNEGGAFSKKPLRDVDTIEQAFGPVVDSLTETLVHGDPSRIKTCAHPDCILKFYDDSKNGARRWCTMSGCGNRAKAAAFLQRKRGES